MMATGPREPGRDIGSAIRHHTPKRDQPIPSCRLPPAPWVSADEILAHEEGSDDALRAEDRQQDQRPVRVAQAHPADQEEVRDDGDLLQAPISAADEEERHERGTLREAQTCQCVTPRATR